MSRRLNINIPDKSAEELQKIADRHNISLTEAIRRAISTEAFIQDAIDGGEQVLLADPAKDSVKQVLFR